MAAITRRNVKKIDVEKIDIADVTDAKGSKALQRWPKVISRRFRLAFKGWGFSAEFERERNEQS